MSELIACSPYIIAGLKDCGGDLPKKRTAVDKKIVPDEIFETVSGYLNMPIEVIKNKGQTDEVVYARKLCVYLIRKNTKLSLNNICKFFTGTLTDHTSVLHCQRFIENQLSGRFINKEILYDVESILRIIKGEETVKLNHINN